MNLANLNKIISDLKLPKFREKQIIKAYFSNLDYGWDNVSVLAKELRSEFSEKLAWSSVVEKRLLSSNKDSLKAVLELFDKEIIETVLIRHKDGRNTVCVSSQVGCPLGCKFCATGKNGFRRNLSPEEIVDQVLYFGRILKKEGRKVTNVVFMGMGEPLLNYDNVLKSVRILNDKEGFNLGARHISISTCGIVPGIMKLSKEKIQLNLALSMHAPNNKKRSYFMPINERYGLEEVFKAVDFYIKTTNRRVMVEYLLIQDMNDKKEDAWRLAEIMKDRPLCYVNLIPYNSIDAKFKTSSRERVAEFVDILKKEKIKHTIRYSFGDSIEAACGQLAGQNKKI